MKSQFLFLSVVAVVASIYAWGGSGSKRNIQTGRQPRSTPVPQAFQPKPVPTLSDAQKKAILSKQIGGVKPNAIFLSEPIKLSATNPTFQTSAKFLVYDCEAYSAADNTAWFRIPLNGPSLGNPTAQVIWNAAKGKTYLVSFGLWRLHAYSDTWNVRWGPSPDYEWNNNQQIQSQDKDPVISVVVKPTKSGKYSAALEPISKSQYNVSYVEITPAG